MNKKILFLILCFSLLFNKSDTWVSFGVNFGIDDYDAYPDYYVENYDPYYFDPYYDPYFFNPYYEPYDFYYQRDFYRPRLHNRRFIRNYRRFR